VSDGHEQGASLIEPGQRLGPYEILDLLGKGGMGEVWLAEDSRLGRKVAIKVLPPEFAADPERVARFEQEARAAAALNDPHIAAVFDIGEHDAGVRFIVQEYLQGQSLKALLADGVPPLKRALGLATEIAEALGAAHAAGIIHRDIKPDNVFVTPDGHAKVLDFGLAKLTEMAANPDASMSPTLLGTIAGQVMGTAGYMAPEQVDGTAAIDHRADLFAFGSLLYEMATGARAFAGRSVADTLSRIQHDEPLALAELNAALPADLQRMVAKLLAKDPAERYQHAADLIVDLRRLLLEIQAGAAPSLGATGGHPRSPAKGTGSHTGSGAMASAVEASRGARTLRLAVLMAVGAVGMAAIGVWIGSRLPSDTVSSTGGGGEFALDLPAEVVELPRGYGANIGISPDGQTIAFIGAREDGSRRLYRRRLEAVGVERLGEMINPQIPVFAKDNEWLAFGIDQTRFLRMKLDGGEPFLLCDACNDGSWGDDGNFYFTRAGALWRQKPDGSDDELVLEPLPEAGVRYIGRPRVLPGSRAVLVEIGDYELGGAAAIALSDGRVVHISAQGSSPIYSPTGHVLFARRSSIFSVPFDAETLEIGGPAEPVLDNVRVENGGAIQADLADNGTLVYAPAVDSPGTSLVLVSRDGLVEGAYGGRRNYFSARVSPDGRRAAVIVNESGRTEVWVVDFETQAMAQITTVESATSPTWSLDGTWVAFGADKDARFAIYAVDIDSQTVSELHTSDHRLLPTAFTRDGTKLLFIEQSATSDVFTLELGGEGATPSIAAVVESEEGEEAATFSFDGRLLAYESESAGRREVFVRDLETSREIQVSTGGGQEPVWSKDSLEVVFRDSSDFWMTAASIVVDPELRVDGTEKLFASLPYWVGSTETAYDSTPEGGFLFVRHRAPDAPADRIHVILNFADRLPR